MSEKMVIELDGIQHYDNGGPEADKKRDEYLKSKGFRVLRFDNAAVCKHLEDVVRTIYNSIKEKKK